jgi:hypothetical protein
MTSETNCSAFIGTPIWVKLQFIDVDRRLPFAERRFEEFYPFICWSLGGGRSYGAVVREIGISGRMNVSRNFDNGSFSTIIFTLHSCSERGK